jgi:hypothetical protein
VTCKDLDRIDGCNLIVDDSKTVVGGGVGRFDQLNICVGDI